MSLRRLCADGSLQDSSAIEAPPSLAITRTNPEGAVGLASICDRVVTVVYTATPWNSTLLYDNSGELIFGRELIRKSSWTITHSTVFTALVAAT